MATITIGEYKLDYIDDSFLAIYGNRAQLVDEVDLTLEEGSVFTLAVSITGENPRLALEQKFFPVDYGAVPGLLLIPETAVLFIGAGRRLVAYNLAEPARLWLDEPDGTFWRWRQHGNVVVMSASHEVAAWNTQGRKLWSQLVEPLWNYEIIDNLIRINVLNRSVEFPLASGPSDALLAQLAAEEAALTVALTATLTTELEPEEE